MRRHPKGRFQLTSCEPAQCSRALQGRHRGRARNWPQREPRPALLFFWTGALGLLSGSGLAPFLLPHRRAHRPLCLLCDSSDAGVPALPGCSAGPCGRGSEWTRPSLRAASPGWGDPVCLCSDHAGRAHAQAGGSVPASQHYSAAVPASECSPGKGAIWQWLPGRLQVPVWAGARGMLRAAGCDWAVRWVCTPHPCVMLENVLISIICL